jgi:anti-sigma-K factor RskA
MTELHANPEDFDLYALDALDGEEKAAFEAHVRTCSACQHELREARERTVLLGLAEAPLAPPSSVKAALMRRIHAENAASNRQIVPEGKRKASWSLRFAMAFAAATVILAVAANWLWKQDRRHKEEIAALQAQLDSAQAQAAQDAATIRAINEVVAAPDTVHVALMQQAGGPPGQAHVLFNARLGVVVYSGQVAPAPADKSYQLWLVPAAGVPVNAGLVAANQQNGAVVVHLQPGLAAKAFAVTLEPHGGMPQPTGPKVLVGALNG